MTTYRVTLRPGDREDITYTGLSYEEAHVLVAQAIMEGIRYGVVVEG